MKRLYTILFSLLLILFFLGNFFLLTGQSEEAPPAFEVDTNLGGKEDKMYILNESERTVLWEKLNIPPNRNRQLLQYLEQESEFRTKKPKYNMDYYRRIKNPPYNELIPNRCHKMDGWNGTIFPTVEVCTNLDGLRDKEYSIEKAENVFRIIGLGDAVTFGLGVNNNETWTSFLERNLNNDEDLTQAGQKFEVINFGFPFWNTKKEIQAFELKALKYTPDLVILQYMENDAQDTSRVDALQKYYFKEITKTISDKDIARNLAEGISFKMVREAGIKQGLDEEMKIVVESLDVLKKLSERYNFKVIIMHYSSLFYKRHLKYMRNLSRKRYHWLFMETDVETIKGFKRKDFALGENTFYLNSLGYESTSLQVLNFLKNNKYVLHKGAPTE